MFVCQSATVYYVLGIAIIYYTNRKHKISHISRSKYNASVHECKLLIYLICKEDKNRQCCCERNVLLQEEVRLSFLIS